MLHHLRSEFASSGPCAVDVAHLVYASHARVSLADADVGRSTNLSLFLAPSD